MKKAKQWIGFLMVLVLAISLCGGTAGVAAEEEYVLGEELLKNGDFEQGAEYWAAEGTPGNVWLKSGVGRDGSAGMKLTEADADANGEVVQFYQGSLDLVPGNRYLLSFDYLAAPKNTFYVRSGSIGCGKNTITLKADADGTWKTFTKVFTVPVTYTPVPGKGLGIYSTVIGDTPAVVDNISIRECQISKKTESVALDYTELTLFAGATHTLKAITTPPRADMNNAVWTSSDDSVVTVQYGMLRAVGGGEATVTVTANGVSDSCLVKVAGDAALLKSGNFENSDGWWVAENATLTEKGYGYANSQGGALAEESILFQKLGALQPKTTYRVIGRVSTPDGQEMKAKVTMADGTELMSVTKAYSKQWKSWEEMTFTTPETVSEATLLFYGTSGTYYVDDVIVAKASNGEDLVAESIDWQGGDGQVKPGTRLKFEVTIKNEGTADVTQPFAVEVLAEGECIASATYEGGVKVGETVTVVTKAWKAKAGDYMVAARVNATCSVVESSTANNACQANLRVAKDRVTPTYTHEEYDVTAYSDLVFNDDFDSLNSIDTLASGREGYKWYVTRP